MKLQILVLVSSKNANKINQQCSKNLSACTKQADRFFKVFLCMFIQNFPTMYRHVLSFFSLIQIHQFHAFHVKLSIKTVVGNPLI